MTGAPMASAQDHEAEPAREPLFPALGRAGDLVFGRRSEDGLAILAPLPFGVTLAGLEQADTQRTFLEFVANGAYLVAYDQRATGASGGTLVGSGRSALGEDLWAVADAAGVERAVLYGVLDGGQTAIEAARLAPERVLGLILNFAPPAWGTEPGVAEPVIADWFSGPEGEIDARHVLNDIGVGETDVAALVPAWEASAPHESAQRLRLLREIDLQPLRECLAPGLIVEPSRRRMFAGWGAAVAAQYPRARVVQTGRGAQALGAIDAYMMWLTSIEGQHASRLSPGQSRTASAAAQSARNVRVIVVPVDEELASARAVDLACRIAESQDATIILASIQVVPRMRALEDPTPEAVERADEALRVAEAVAARRDAHFRTQLFLARGYVDGVVRVAQQQAADLIVLPNPASNFGLHLDDQALQELFTRAPCEVLIDRGHGEGE